MPYKRTGRPSGRPKKTPRKSGEEPKLTDKQWKGVRFETAHPNASLAKIASAAGVTRQCVHQWRKNSNYTSGKDWLQVRDGVESYKKDDAERTKKISDKAKKRTGDPDTTLELLYWELKNNWPGSVVSPLDGLKYTDRDAFHKHIEDWRSDDGGRVVWVEPQPNKPVKK